MRYQLELKSKCCLRTWYSRVLTEANISDGPSSSRQQNHHLLVDECDVTTKAWSHFEQFWKLWMRCKRDVEKEEVRSCYSHA